MSEVSQFEDGTQIGPLEKGAATQEVNLIGVEAAQNEGRLGDNVLATGVWSLLAAMRREKGDDRIRLWYTA